MEKVSTKQEETINELKAADSSEEWEPLIARLETDLSCPSYFARDKLSKIFK